MFLHPALDLKVFVVQLKTFMVQSKTFMVCGSSGAAQDCPHPALCGHLVLAEPKEGTKGLQQHHQPGKGNLASNQPGKGHLSLKPGFPTGKFIL